MERETIMAILTKCKCQHCNQSIEFDASGAGQLVPCPNCGMETVLFVPPLPKTDLPCVAVKGSSSSKQSTTAVSLFNGLLCAISIGLIFFGCAAEISEIQSPNGSAIRSAGNAVQFCSGFILMGICLAISALTRLINK